MGEKENDGPQPRTLPFLFKSFNLPTNHVPIEMQFFYADTGRPQFFHGDPRRPSVHHAAGSASVWSTAETSEGQIRRRLAGIRAEIHRLSCAQKTLCWQLQSLQQPEPSTSPSFPQVFLINYSFLRGFNILIGRLNAATIALRPTTWSLFAPFARLLISPRHWHLLRRIYLFIARVFEGRYL